MKTEHPEKRLTIEMFRAEMPKSVQAALPNLLWDQEKLWSLKRPVTEMSTNTFAHLLLLPIWHTAEQHFQVRPVDVLTRPQDFPDSYQRVQAADLQYPIHVTRQDNSLIIVDGYHRLCKAIDSGRTTITVMELSAEDLETIKVDYKVL